MNLKFYLNKQKASKEGYCPVYMYITFNGNRIRRPVSGVRSTEKDWDEKKQRIKKSHKASPFDEIDSLNNRLESIEGQISAIKQTAFDRRIAITENYIIDRLNDESLIKADNYDFFALTEQYIKAVKPVNAERTIMGKNTVFNFLEDFKKFREEAIHLEKIDQGFFEELRTYAFEERKIEDNYFAKIISVLKAFLRWAAKRKYLKNQDFREFKASERETEIICLTEGEFKKLRKHKFPSTRLTHVRDVFIFGCVTGLRFSDLISLEKPHLDGLFIKKMVTKTKEKISIPLNKYSIAILNKYKGTIHEPLPRISSQKFNEYIKECCEAAKINTPTTVIRYSGSEIREKTFAKHELITSHAARKTFTTLSLTMGVQERVVKEITGHKKDQNFRRYVNFSKNHLRQNSNEAWNKMK